MSSSFTRKRRRSHVTIYEGEGQEYQGDSEVFPDRKLLKLLLRKVYYDPGGPFLFLLDYGGLWYLYLLRYNEKVRDSVENKLLQNINEALPKEKEDPDMWRETKDCLQLFWPFLKADYEAQLEEGIEKVTLEGSAKKALRKLEVRTIDGALQAREHSEEIRLPESQPVENTCSDLKLFSKDEIVVLKKLAQHVFKIRIKETEYVLKELPIGLFNSLDEMAFRREFELLQKIPRHPNLVWLVGARDAGKGKIDGLVLPYIRGRLLQEVGVATSAEKEKWKKQVSDVVHLLHEKDIVWSDAKPENILIKDKNDDVVLIDFGGGTTHGWVDRKLAETKEGDLQGLERILEFIENR